MQSFRTTRWTVVRRATGQDEKAMHEALSVLCQDYWYPIYAFLRRSGKSAHDAEDLTQGFFVRLLQKEMLAGADPEKGKLRTFLLSCLQNYVADEHDRAHALKRGGGQVVSFDAVEAEKRYTIEPREDLSPDRLFQRRWAMTLLNDALTHLSGEYATPGKRDLFAALRPFLGFGTGATKSYEDLMTELGVPVGTLKNHVFRMRERWRELLLEKVAETLEDPSPEEIRAELGELIGYV